jgi:hypothetical protein
MTRLDSRARCCVRLISREEVIHNRVLRDRPAAINPHSMSCIHVGVRKGEKEHWISHFFGVALHRSRTLSKRCPYIPASLGTQQSFKDSDWPTRL